VTTVLQTDHLILREWVESDVEAFSALSSDPLVMRYINGGNPITREQTADQIGRLISLQRSHGWTRWALELREPAKGEPRGAVGFCGPGCTFAPDIEVGWWLHSALWNRGLVTEAAQVAVRYCFETIGFERVICCVHPDNAASLAVARKSGFTPADTFEFNGVPLVRLEQFNPGPLPPKDPRFIRTCEGAPTGPSIVSTGADAEG